jgi:hypothetical protein
MKIPLKTMVSVRYLHRCVIITKHNVAKPNWKEIKTCFFCHHDETMKHLLFQCKFARSVWSLIQVRSTIHPPRSGGNIFGNLLNGVEHRFKLLIRVGGWERSALFCLYGYIKITRFLMIQIFLLCRSSNCAQVFSY